MMSGPTTVQEQVDISAAEPLRLLPITVNLLPEEVIQARAGRAAMRGAIAVLVAAVLGTGSWYYLAHKDAENAASALASAQSQAAQADKGRNGFGALNNVKSQITSIRGELATATAGDVAWAKVNASIAGLTVRNRLVVTSLADNSATDPSGTGSSTTAAANTTGTVVITGSAVSKTDVSAFSTRLESNPYLVAPAFVSNVSVGDSGTINFTINVSTSQAALNYRYQQKKVK